MKKYLKVISVPFIMLLIVGIYIIYLINSSEKYLKYITKNIKDNYQINEKITYSNEYNNYYIFTTKTRVIVLNNEYTEILNESIANIKKRQSDQELIYKTNKLMYEESILKDNKLIYKYYDATNGEFIKETVMEQR